MERLGLANTAKNLNQKLQWERVLFRKFDLPDNYYDETQFLNQLRKNETVVHYSLKESLIGACMVMSQVNIIVLYFCTFEYVQLKTLESYNLVFLAVLLISFCFILYLILNWNSMTYTRFNDNLRTLLTLLLFSNGFTPIIRTLTTSISTDTIYTTSFGLFFLSLVFHDYGLEAPIVSTTFSASLSLAASVFLISRVERDDLAFCLLALALCAFGFWPLLRNSILSCCIWCNILTVVFLLVLCPLSIALVHSISSLLGIIHSVFHLFLLLACPLLLVQMQHFKNTIHGPWDEASVKQSSMKNEL